MAPCLPRSPWRRSLAAVAALGATLAFPAAAQPAGAARTEQAAATPPALYTPQLLVNPAFNEGLSGWALSADTNVALGHNAPAEDSTYVETNVTQAGGGLAQLVATKPVAGHAYQFRVMLRSPQRQAVRVGVALSALGGSPPPVAQTTGVTVKSTTWRTVQVSLDVTTRGYRALEAVVYLLTTGANVDVDGASLADAGLRNPSFNEGLDAWGNEGATATVLGGGGADGYHFLRVSADGHEGFVYHDVPATAAAGHSYRGEIWVRSPFGHADRVTLALAALGGRTVERRQTSAVVTSSSWSLLRVDLDVTGHGHDLLRLSVHPGNRAVDVDGASLHDAGLANASFEEGAGSWSVTPGANLGIFPGHLEDHHYLAMNTGSAGVGAGITQSFPGTVIDGDAYQASIALRSASGAKVGVGVVLWAVGGPDAAEEQTTSVTLGSRDWTDVPVELDVTNPGYQALALTVYLVTNDENVDLDAASISQAPAPGGTGPLESAIAKVAESQDQYHAAVAADPPGSDCNIYSTYWGVGTPCGNGLDGQPWCASFAAWVWRQAGVAFSWGYGSDQLNPESYSFVQWGEDNGTFTTSDPQVGDAVVWGDAATGYGQHVGIVTGVRGGEIDVVSGNWANAVEDEGWFNPVGSTVAGYPLIGYTSPVSEQPQAALPVGAAEQAPSLVPASRPAIEPVNPRRTRRQIEAEIARQHAP